MKVKVKQAMEHDFEWISSIQKSAKLPIWKPNSTSWIIGKSAFAIWQKMGNESELLSIAVRKKSRGKGYAKQLMEFAQKELGRLGADNFFLEVKENNEAAISLYQKLGYEKISERKRYYPDDEPALIMKLANI
ncbi:MAG: GNAT family N-acetyltransferase [Fibromonadaceae bacterium]|jgi:ribosomal protein S18 acetylase RimI-like enzyme|nr:GNAT family N-acetyltransferase [Fibromonadaceae bacterium]